MHRLRAAANESKGTKATSTHSSKKRERLLTQKRQLIGYSTPALAQVCCISAVVLMVLKLPQKIRPVIPKVNELDRCEAIAQVGSTKLRHQGGQYRTIGSSNVKHDKNLTPNASRIIEPSPLYIIKASLGKGLGMFATKDIPRGTRILAEEPFFSLKDRPLISESDPYAPNEILNAYDRLPASQQHKYMGLHCPERSDCSRGVSIYEANCFEMGSGNVHMP